MQERNGWPKDGDIFIVYGDGHGEVQRNGNHFIWTSNYKQLHKWYEATLKTEYYFDSL